MLDKINSLSLTKLLLFVLIVKITVSPILDWPVICALFLALANYNGKKWLEKFTEDKVSKDSDRLKAVETEIKAITSAMTLKGLGYLK